MNTDEKKKKIHKDCGVDEEMFPCTGKCCRKNDASLMASCEKTCPYCVISVSLPYGESLKTVTIFECGKFGYGKRINK